jgi:ubiquinone biosynthesis monooxygenase Coq7
MNAAEQLTIARILKVNHAGEHGAIRIYRAQLWVARRLYPDAVAFLEETLGHEVRHCALFRSAMPARQARPCRVMALWGNGGYVLGFLTALMGRQGIWICTAAVESAVHRHLDDQLHFLRSRDPELNELVLSIQEEELSHLHHAEERITTRGFRARALNGLITWSTDAVIWLSTWGDSTRMARELAAAHRQG